MAANQPQDVFSTEERKRRASEIYTTIKIWETRLLRLHPGDAGDPLVIGLEVAVITYNSGMGIVRENRNVKYTALSYTWGAAVFSHVLKINGIDFSITANLHEALLRIRSKEKDMWLWADALSINQYDKDEKRFQIHNMFTIFQKAELVLVWLGQAADTTETAMRFAEEMVASDFQLPSNHQDTPAMVLQGCQDLLRRDWFSRVWVIQEVAAAVTTSVYCGPHCTTWEAIQALPIAIRMLAGNPKLESKPDLILENSSEREVRSESAMQIMNEARNDLGFYSPPDYQWRSPTFGLLRLFSRVVQANIQATEPLDRIYSLLNLVDYPSDAVASEGRPYLEVNYEVDQISVLARLCKILMNEEKSPSFRRLDIILPDLSDAVGNVANIPTWLSFFWYFRPEWPIDSSERWVQQNVEDSLSFDWVVKAIGYISILNATEDALHWVTVASYHHPADALKLSQTQMGTLHIFRFAPQNSFPPWKIPYHFEHSKLLLGPEAREGDLLVVYAGLCYLLRSVSDSTFQLIEHISINRFMKDAGVPERVESDGPYVTLRLV